MYGAIMVCDSALWAVYWTSKLVLYVIQCELVHGACLCQLEQKWGIRNEVKMEKLCDSNPRLLLDTIKK